MTRYTLEIPRWRPALLNELMHSVRTKIRLKKRDREMVCAYAWQAKFPPAGSKRRVSLHVTLGKGMREFDVDAWQKSGLDAMKHAKLIVDDSIEFVEIGSLTFSRDPKTWGTRITLEELE
jgi:Holliday junction resolvase RusA-like endonuclease